jgi:hypothetical protein
VGGAGPRLQGLDWARQLLRQDEDGDYAHDFIEVDGAARTKVD